MESIIPLIIGMGLVTYIPRLFHLIVLTDKKTGKKFKEFLMFIPYTSLSILILRGIITSTREMRLPTIIGVGISALVSYIQGSLLLSILAGIVSSFITINLLN